MFVTNTTILKYFEYGIGHSSIEMIQNGRQWIISSPNRVGYFPAFSSQHSLRHLNHWGSYTTSLVEVLLLSMLMLMLMLLSLPQVGISTTTVQPAVFTETAFAVRGIYSLLCHGACLKLSSKNPRPYTPTIASISWVIHVYMYICI